MNCLSGLGSCYAVVNHSDERERIKKLHLKSSTDNLWSERGYLGLLGSGHILVNYPIISYQMIKVYRAKKWTWEYSSGTMVSGENEIILSTIVFIVRDDNPLVGFIRC